jgi:spore maturation protein CgeB
MDRITGVRILFTGQYWSGANSMYIARAFERCGAVVRILNETGIFPSWQGRFGRGTRRVLRPLIEAEFNRQLLELANSFSPDLVYITNADFCFPSTVRELKRRGFPVMCFYHDVQWKDRPGTRFSENIAEFDLVATTRHWQEAGFKDAGAKAVSVVRFGFDPQVHRPVRVSQPAIDKYGSDIVFIGTCENQRAHDLNSLVSSSMPYTLNVWGGLWDRLTPEAPVLAYWKGRAVHEQEIPVIYAASKVALHWVGWEPHGRDQLLMSGDQHNSRTFQIAACEGAIMLAQRTEEHVRFFREDSEAVFFSDLNELRYKLDEWLDPKRDTDRRRMAQAARARCLAEDYTYGPVADSFLRSFGLPSTLVE